eukprot:GDKJ01019667.1.p1 GENE.GDKJ01019667.1~~GDKJ01019667.1.p1  ORF type:complete len:451 (+),score=89.78 GDKJ01019667.1:68-1420(+)
MDDQLMDIAFKELEKSWLEDQSNFSKTPWVFRNQLKSLFANVGFSEFDKFVDKRVEDKSWVKFNINRDQVLISWNLAFEKFSSIITEAVDQEINQGISFCLIKSKTKDYFIQWTTNHFIPFICLNSPISVSEILNCIFTDTPQPQENVPTNLLPLKTETLDNQIIQGESSNKRESYDENRVKNENPFITIDLSDSDSEDKNVKSDIPIKRESQSSPHISPRQPENKKQKLTPVVTSLKAKQKRLPPPPLSTSTFSSTSDFLLHLLEGLRSLQLTKLLTNDSFAVSPPSFLLQSLQAASNASIAIEERRKREALLQSSRNFYAAGDVLGAAGLTFGLKSDIPPQRQRWVISFPALGVFERQLIEARPKFAQSIVRSIKKEEFFFAELERLCPPRPVGTHRGVSCAAQTIMTSFLVRDFIGQDLLCVLERPQGKVLVRNLVLWKERFLKDEN